MRSQNFTFVQAVCANVKLRGSKVKCALKLIFVAQPIIANA